MPVMKSVFFKWQDANKMESKNAMSTGAIKCIQVLQKKTKAKCQNEELNPDSGVGHLLGHKGEIWNWQNESTAGQALDLRDGICFDAAVVASRHFFGENFPAGRVDAFTDDDERPVESDAYFLAGRTDHGFCH